MSKNARLNFPPIWHNLFFTSSPDKSQELLFDLRAIVRQSSARKTERWKFRPSTNICSKFTCSAIEGWNNCKVKLFLVATFYSTKVRWRFRKILWPSQNIWTLNLRIASCTWNLGDFDLPCTQCWFTLERKWQSCCIWS